MSGSRSYPDLLTFEERVLETLASGQVVESWASRFLRWGAVTQTAAAEAVADDQKRTVENYAVRLPFDAIAGAVTAAGWRVSWLNQLNQTRVLNLTGVDTSVRGRVSELKLSATLER